MKVAIKKIHARQILDSRGNPTVEVECLLENGICERAAVPSGASTGTHEAVELRDGVQRHFSGKGVLSAVANVNSIIGPALQGDNVFDQVSLDQAMIDMDGTANKGRLGANSILGVSMAVARAAATASGMPLFRYLGGVQARRLPVPMMNIINGGVHANWEGADFQEYMIVPYGAASLSQSVEWGVAVYHALKVVLKERGYGTGVGDEGGFAPAVKSNTEPLELILEAVDRTGLSPGRDVGIAMDPASSEFYVDGSYRLRTEGRQLPASEMVLYYRDIASMYPCIVLEDGLSEDDWQGWRSLFENLGSDMELVGDDLFVTNVKRIQRGIEEGCANGVLIKLNQAGTLSETVAAVHMAHGAGWGAMVSHRSGETVDSFIADMAVGLDTGHIKTGAPARGERVEKYNQLMRIEEYLGASAEFAGKDGFACPVRF